MSRRLRPLRTSGRSVALLCLGLALLAGCAAERGGDAPPAAPPADGTETAERTPAEPLSDGSPQPATEDDCDDPLGCYGQPERIGAFDAEVVPEASGLAASRRNPGLLYLLDDRPGTSQVWVLDADATMLGAIEVDGMQARDTEDLAVGACGPDDETTCVYVGDIGDHDGSRDGVTIHRFAEPDLSAGVPERVDADAVRLRYPEGWHDAETLLVDEAGALLIVTKAPHDRSSGETGEHRLYGATSFADATLTDLGAVDVPEPSQPLQSSFVGNVVTGGDAASGRVLLRTYDQALEFVAPEAGADLGTFPSWPVREVPSAFEPQSEAIAWAVERCGYYTASEQVGVVWFVPCTDDRRP